MINLYTIAMFNNKGGVGKTTLTCNISAYLAELGYKVLVVDADPQCNSTINLFPEDDFETMYYKKEGYTIHDVVKSVQRGEGYVKEIKTYHIENYKIDFIAGDPRLSFFEDILSTDWKDSLSGGERGIRTTMTFKNLVDRCSDYDFILFDLGPSLGAINRSILLACNYFITPMSSDIFSILAIENIGKTIIKWKDDFKIGFDRCEDTETTESLKPLPNLRFAGYITQQYTAKSTDGVRRPVLAYERVLRDIPAVIKRELIDSVNNDSADINYVLGSIPNFNSIIPMSQTAHKPAFSLISADGVVGSHFSKVKEFKDIISLIVTNLLSNLEALND